ncbi:hypothetical protein [Symbiobacterium thermophilum]|uniref:Uncharacterized protein n=2 Tax=Symbiobacterium thermophilum TaxID=2734 RepID=Q67KY7_SYMTH|nr:hypothetical protein [Symbiobacterium thermophilum]MBY6275234.1 hypothetical protein [Symbiobacterium thermophilum]BAD41659.1 hypothetical protein STH2674 [Symbiobacterium thermophilum IAM 14863]
MSQTISREEMRQAYLDILERAEDATALRLAIICSDQFPETLKERARLAPSLEALRALLAEHRRRSVPVG